MFARDVQRKIDMTPKSDVCGDCFALRASMRHFVISFIKNQSSVNLSNYVINKV